MNGLPLKTRRTLLQICLLWAALLPAAVEAQLIFTTNNSAITITGYNGNPGIVVIPSATNGYPVTSIATSAFANKTTLTNVTVSGSVTNIASWAFFGCSSLMGIYFQGNAPAIDSTVFVNTSVTVYYLPGTSGWSSPFGNHPAVMLNPPNPAGSLKVTLSPTAAITNGARWQVDGGVVQPSGATVLGLSAGSHTVSFIPANGWATPVSQSIAVSANSTNTTTGNYYQLTYATNNGAITITGTALGGAVILPNTINGLPITSIGTNAFQNCTSLTSVTVPSSITNIGDFAFNGCSILGTIYLQGNAPSVGSSVFNGDPGNVYYPPGTSGWGSTFGNRPAVMLNPPTPAGSLKVTLAPAAAITAGAQWQVDGGVVQPSGAVVFGLSVSSHTVSFFPINGWITPVSQSVAVSANSTNTLTGNYYQLTYTTNNGALTITGYSGPGGAVVLPGAINGLPVTSIGTNAFQNITVLGSLTIPDSVTNIGNFAFYGCINLTGIFFQGNAPISGSNLFQNTPTTNYYQPGTSGWSSFFSSRPAVMLNPPNPAGSLKVTLASALGGTAPAQWRVDGGVVQPGGATVLGLSVGNHTVSFGPLNGWTMPASQSIAVSANSTATASGTYFPLTYTSSSGAVTITGYSGNTRPSGDVILPDTINGLPVTSIAYYAFQNCGSLTNITIGTNVTSIGTYVFVSCTHLTNITVSDSLTNLAPEALDACPSLTTITVSPGNLFYSTINGVLFNKNQTMLVRYPCGASGNYTIPQTVTNLGDSAFATCANLTNITMPNGITSIGHNTFASCIGLGSVTIPDSVKIIWEYGFSGCTGLTNITFGNGITSIEADAFYGCSSLTSLTIPDSVIATGDYAFYGCTNLTSVTMGVNVSYIFGIAFPNCPSLTGIYFRGNAPSLVEYGYLLAPDSTATAYYLPWTTGWPAPGEQFGGQPTALWLPQAQTSDASFGVQTNQFGFNITWASDMVVVVEACTDLANPDWTPVGTNTLTGGSSYFSDSQWTNYPGRFYRLRSP